MTFDQFRASGVDCDDLGAALNDAMWDKPAKGRIYHDSYWIERRPETGWVNQSPEEWYLLLERSDFLSDNLSELECRLYLYVIESGGFDDDEVP